MPAFVKKPKFIIGVIIVLWIAYIIYGNFQLNPVMIKLLPFGVSLQFHVSTVVIASAIVGCVLTLVVQWLWARRSKSASVSAPAASSKSKTVA